MLITIETVPGEPGIGAASSAAAGQRHAFAYDLAATVPAMRNLGALARLGPVSTATDVDAGVVVGTAAPLTEARPGTPSPTTDVVRGVVRVVR